MERSRSSYVIDSTRARHRAEMMRVILSRPRKDHRDEPITERTDRQLPDFAVSIACRREEQLAFKRRHDIKKVDAVLVGVREALPFVPLEFGAGAHAGDCSYQCI